MGIGSTLGGALGATAGSAVAPGAGTAVGGKVGAKAGETAEKKVKELLGGSPPIDDVIDYMKKHSCEEGDRIVRHTVRQFQTPRDRATFMEQYASGMLTNADECDIGRLLMNSKGFFFETTLLKMNINELSDACDWDRDTYDEANEKLADKEYNIIDKVEKKWKEGC